MTTGRWVQCHHPRPRASRRLICFPHAGGGASFFRDWSGLLPGDIELWAVQYPGREDRFAEPCIDDMDTLVHRVVDEMESMPDDRPVAIFGHSMGASVAYEVTRQIEAHRPGLVRRLFVSAREAPRHQKALTTTIHLLDDDGITGELAVLGGTHGAVLADAEMRSFLLPMIRSDHRLIESYEPAPAAPLDVGIVAMVGAGDTSIDVLQARAWCEATRGDFRLAVFPGGHFYLVGERSAVVAEISKASNGQEDRVTVEGPFAIEDLRAAVADLVERKPAAVGDDDNLIELGIDSMRMMILATRWQQRHGVEVGFDRLAETPTIAAWSALLSQAAG